MSKAEPRKRTTWSLIYRGISIEAVNWSIPGYKEDCWAGYMYLHSKSHPEILGFDVDLSSKYTDRIPVFDDLPFHCGVTFSEITRHREDVRMKVGCDYQHYWDEGREYEHGIVLNDMCKVVDEYREKFPEPPESKGRETRGEE